MRKLFVVALAAAGLLAAVPQLAGSAHGAIQVDTTAEAQAAIERIGNGAGTIVLERGRYGKLVVGPRARNARWLTIRAEPGALTKHVVVARARRVRLVNLRVTNYWGGEALVLVARSSGIRLERLEVEGKPGRVARLRVWRSANVGVRGSDLSRCGEGAVCLGMPGSSSMIVAGNTFHDCFGCDFVHVSRVHGLTMRGNTFDRALPGPCGTQLGCNHQDLVQVVGGYDLLIEANRFGLYSYGAAQLYVSGQYGADNITIRGNVFRRSDPAVPGLEAANGIIVGNPPGTRGLPTHVLVAGNTIMSGSPRDPERFRYWPGVSNSLLISEGYETVAPELRPLVVNNVVGRTSHPELTCAPAQASGYNLYADAAPCSDLDLTGDPMVDADGLPLEGSPLIGRAEPSWATPLDHSGYPRDGAPDIGAFEWR